MFFISCIVFIFTVILGFWFGGALSLFTDQTFPTVLLLVVLPTAFFILSIHSFRAVKTTFRALKSAEPNSQAQAVLKSCGNLAMLIGVMVTIVNLMSIAFNWSATTTPEYLAVAIATAIMSILIGLVIRILCVAGSYRLQSENQRNLT